MLGPHHYNTNITTVCTSVILILILILVIAPQTLTVVRDGDRLFFQLRPAPQQHAHEKAVHVYVKNHPAVPAPQRCPPKYGLYAARFGARRESGVDHLDRVGSPAEGSIAGAQVRVAKCFVTITIDRLDFILFYWI